MKYLIKAENIVKKFGNVVAVNNLNLQIEEKIFYGIVGPNASGKTTTVRILTGQLKPDSGKAYVNGVDVSNYVEVRKNVGIVPEEEYPPSFLTAEEYLEFVCKVRQVDNMKDKINHWIDFLDFDYYRNFLIKDLSRGTKQKIMLAQAFIHEPKIVFLDEPFINVDPVVQKKFKKFLKDYVRKGNLVVFCTHILPLAKELCEKVGIMKNGKIVKEVSGKKIEKEFFKWF